MWKRNENVKYIRFVLLQQFIHIVFVPFWSIVLMVVSAVVLVWASFVCIELIILEFEIKIEYSNDTVDACHTLYFQCKSKWFRISILTEIFLFNLRVGIAPLKQLPMD